MPNSPRVLEEASTQLPEALHELLALLPADEQQALEKVWTLHRTVVNTQQQLQAQQGQSSLHELVPPLNAFNGLSASSKVAKLLPQIFTGYSYVGLQTIIGGLSLDSRFRPDDIYTQQMQSMPPEAMLLSPNSCLRSIFHLGTANVRTDFNRKLIASFPEDTSYIAAVTLLQAPVAFAPGVTPGAVAPRTSAAASAANNPELEASGSANSPRVGTNSDAASCEVRSDDPALYFIPTIFVLTSEGYFVTTVTLEAMPHPYLRFGDNLTMSEIVGDLAFQLHLQHRRERMYVHLVRPDPQCARDAAPGQRPRIGKPQFLAGMEYADFLHRRLDSLDAQRFLGFVIDKQIQGLLILRQGASAQELGIADPLPGIIHCFPVICNPISQIQKNFFLTLVKGTVFLRTYVQKHPPAQGDAVAEHAHDLPAGLIIVVAGPVSPGGVDGGAKLPLPLRSVKRNPLLRRFIIPVTLHTGIEYHIGI